MTQANHPTFSLLNSRSLLAQPRQLRLSRGRSQTRLLLTPEVSAKLPGLDWPRDADNGRSQLLRLAKVHRGMDGEGSKSSEADSIVMSESLSDSLLGTMIETLAVEDSRGMTISEVGDKTMAGHGRLPLETDTTTPLLHPRRMFLCPTIAGMLPHLDQMLATREIVNGALRLVCLPWTTGRPSQLANHGTRLQEQ